MPLITMFASQALFLLYLASVAAAQDDGTYYDGGTNAGRVVAGVIASIVIILIMLVVIGLVYHRRRRHITTLPVSNGESSGFTWPVYPNAHQQQTQAAESRLTPGWGRVAAEPQLPAYTPPPPPYRRKETYQGENEETIEDTDAETVPQADEYAPPPGTPPPAHVNDSVRLSRYIPNSSLNFPASYRNASDGLKVYNDCLHTVSVIF
ncbi:hypothetical protein AcW1_006572 [Taiwanofungus camphoratus]|nr:hypothetical protein AcV5_009158 [Antrodia cinnamomea]KAI0924450.1 hypothetical protein AcW2_005332 [Antrodia cinnamomea]KAI0954787.1 hypothetical protein AcW1_006572 [Antrodia cinnamomea]